jgi:hypothetical protein
MCGAGPGCRLPRRAGRKVLVQRQNGDPFPPLMAHCILCFTPSFFAPLLQLHIHLSKRSSTQCAFAAGVAMTFEGQGGGMARLAMLCSPYPSFSFMLAACLMLPCRDSDAVVPLVTHDLPPVTSLPQSHLT